MIVERIIKTETKIETTGYSKTVEIQITNHGYPIDAHWNSFKDIQIAKEYLKTMMTHLPSAKYGFVMITTEEVQ